MNENVKEKRAREHQEDLAKLRGLRPIDDDFMRCIFRDNLPLAQMVLRILTGIQDLQVISIETQKDLKRLVGARSVCLDAYASDSSGKKYDLEIQRSTNGAGSHRARYHASSMDIENLDAGQEFEELPDTYTIFITEEDFFAAGKAFYPIERMNLATGNLFEDGSHILYINGSYRDDTEIGKLMHDFSCWNPDEMNYAELQTVTRYYKENPKGVEMMCKAFEDTREQGRAEGRAEGQLLSIKSLMKTMKWTAAEAMDALNIPKEEQPTFAAML